MKKSVFVLILVASIFISGCGKDSSDKNREILTNFEGTAEIICNNKTYECEIYKTSEQLGVLKIKKPESLEGLTFSYENGKNQIYWKDLSCESTKELLSNSSAINLLFESINCLNSDENLKEISSSKEETTFNGMCGPSSFQIVVSTEGFIKSIKFPEKNIEVKLNHK